MAAKATLKVPRSLLNRLDRIERALWRLESAITSQSGVLSAVDKELPSLKHSVYGSFKAIADWKANGRETQT